MLAMGLNPNDYYYVDLSCTTAHSCAHRRVVIMSCFLLYLKWPYIKHSFNTPINKQTHNRRQCDHDQCDFVFCDICIIATVHFYVHTMCTQQKQSVGHSLLRVRYVKSVHPDLELCIVKCVLRSQFCFGIIPKTKFVGNK